MPKFENAGKPGSSTRVVSMDPQSGRKKKAALVNTGKGNDDFKKEMQQQHRAELAATEANFAPERIFVSTCHTCQHPHRDWIEMMLLKGMSYKKLGDTVSPKVDRRSISNHYKEHMDLQDAALRRIIEDEARLQGLDFEEGVQDAITKRSVLEVALRKGYEDVLNGVTTVEPRDLIQIAKVLAEMDSHQYQIGLDEARAQVQLFIQAIKNVCGRYPDGEAIRTDIAKEVKMLRKREGSSTPTEKMMEDKPQIEEGDEVVEAEVVEV